MIWDDQLHRFCDRSLHQASALAFSLLPRPCNDGSHGRGSTLGGGEVFAHMHLPHHLWKAILWRQTWLMQPLWLYQGHTACQSCSLWGLPSTKPLSHTLHPSCTSQAIPVQRRQSQSGPPIRFFWPPPCGTWAARVAWGGTVWRSAGGTDRSLAGFARPEPHARAQSPSEREGRPSAFSKS